MSTEADAYVARMRPTTAHCYLGAVGTRPDRQRNGLAIAVLAPVLEHAAACGVDAYVETSAADTIVPGGDPRVCGMRHTYPV